MTSLGKREWGVRPNLILFASLLVGLALRKLYQKHSSFSVHILCCSRILNKQTGLESNLHPTNLENKSYTVTKTMMHWIDHNFIRTRGQSLLCDICFPLCSTSTILHYCLSLVGLQKLWNCCVVCSRTNYLLWAIPI